MNGILKGHNIFEVKSLNVSLKNVRFSIFDNLTPSIMQPARSQKALKF